MSRARCDSPRLWPSTTEVPNVAKATCSIEGCPNPVRARELCEKHYRQSQRERQTALCSVADCPSIARHLGWCDTHYKRWRKTGTTDPRIRRTIEERFWEKVILGEPPVGDPSLGPCRLFTGGLDTKGYGQFWMGTRADGRLWRAHHISWLLAGKTVPELPARLDHLCHTADVRAGLCLGGPTCLHRRCIEDTHLEVVTHAENMARGARAWIPETHCKYNHEFTPENTYHYGTRQRMCRICMKRRNLEALERKRLADH
jgi:hypothetical protein